VFETEARLQNALLAKLLVRRLPGLFLHPWAYGSLCPSLGDWMMALCTSGGPTMAQIVMIFIKKYSKIVTVFSHNLLGNK